MKRSSIYVAAALASALAVGGLAGCGNQPATSESAPAETQQAEQTQEEIVAELKNALKSVPNYKSVTITQGTKAVFTKTAEADANATEGEANATEASANETSVEPESIETLTVYQYDMTGDKLKTCMTSNIDNITLQYFSDGDDAVIVTDQDVYGGTTEQFDEPHFDGVDTLVEETIGNLDNIIDCTATIAKEQQADTTVYKLTLDTEKYIQSDEILTMMADYGDPILKAEFAMAFNKDGYLVTLDELSSYSSNDMQQTLTFSDFDSTVIDPMPEATKTYEQMEEDIDTKMEIMTLLNKLDVSASTANEVFGNNETEVVANETAPEVEVE